MKKLTILFEIILTLILLGLFSVVLIPNYRNLKDKSVIESVSYTLITGINYAIENSISWMYLEENRVFKLNDILVINNKEMAPGLRWRYTIDSEYRDGTYTLKDETHITPQVVLRITLDKEKKVVKYRINCNNINIETHKRLRELCIDKWGDGDIVEEVSF
jgi:hypothetical protein